MSLLKSCFCRKCKRSNEGKTKVLFMFYKDKIINQNANIRLLAVQKFQLVWLIFFNKTQKKINDGKN